MYKIILILFLCGLSTACMNAKYIDDPDQYFDLLGETTESKNFERFVHQLEPKEMPQLSNQFWNDEFPKLDFYDQSLMFPQNGIEMLLKNKKIVSIKLYLPDQEVSFANYKGRKLPLGLFSDDTEKEVTKKLKTHKDTNTNPHRNVKEFETEKASVAIDQATGKIIYIELHEHPLQD
nr:hypothetical protein F987_03331 [Acinetobacter gyllenbergii NIPH 230]